MLVFLLQYMHELSPTSFLGLDLSEVAHCVVEEGSCPNSIRCSAPLTLHIGDCSFFNKGDAQLLLDKDMGYSDVLFDVSNVLIRTSNRSSGSTAQLFSTPRTKLVRSVLPPSAYACRRGAAKSTRPASKSSEMQAGNDEKDEGGVVYIIESILDACDSKTEPCCSQQDDHCCSVKKQTGVPAIKQSEQSWTIELWAKIEAMFSASESLVVDQTTGSAENDNNTGKYCRQSFRKLSNNKVFDRYPFQVINTDQLVKKKRNIPGTSAGDRSETESDALGVDHTRGHGSHVNRAQKQGSTPCPSEHQNSAEYAYSDLLMALRIGERKLPQSFDQQILALAPARVIKSLFLNLPAHFCVSPSQSCCSVIKAGSLLPSPSKRSKAEGPLLVSAKETTAGDNKEEREGSTSSIMSLLDNPSSSTCDSCDVRSAIGCLLARLREGRQPWPSNEKTTWFKFRLVYQALGEFCN
uniref:Uncharacterized protein n=1 Tax=Heterosigma akashiwo TaxID=2829 RepID=A0A7S4D9N6_HETAK